MCPSIKDEEEGKCNYTPRASLYAEELTKCGVLYAFTIPSTNAEFCADTSRITDIHGEDELNNNEHCQVNLEGFEVHDGEGEEVFKNIALGFQNNLVVIREFQQLFMKIVGPANPKHIAKYERFQQK